MKIVSTLSLIIATSVVLPSLALATDYKQEHVDSNRILGYSHHAGEVSSYRNNDYYAPRHLDGYVPNYYGHSSGEASRYRLYGDYSLYGEVAREEDICHPVLNFVYGEEGTYRVGA